MRVRNASSSSTLDSIARSPSSSSPKLSTLVPEKIASNRAKGSTSERNPSSTSLILKRSEANPSASGSRFRPHVLSRMKFPSIRISGFKTKPPSCRRTPDRCSTGAGGGGGLGRVGGDWACGAVACWWRMISACASICSCSLRMVSLRLSISCWSLIISSCWLVASARWGGLRMSAPTATRAATQRRRAIEASDVTSSTRRRMAMVVAAMAVPVGRSMVNAR